MTRQYLNELEKRRIKEIDGERYAVDDNGEIIYNYRVTRTLTPKQYETYSKEKQKEIAPLHSEFIEDQQAKVSESYFIFMIYEPAKKFLSEYLKMKKGDYSRLVYLATFLQLNNTRIKLNRKSYAKKTDIKTMLDIPERTARDFLHRAIDSGIIFIDDNDYVNISNHVFKNGSVGRTTKTRHFAKLYVQNTRALYRAFKDSKNVAKIDTLYSLIPFLDLKHNVLCENANESIDDVTELIPLTADRMCEILGVKDSRYLSKVLNALKVTIDDITYSLTGELKAHGTDTTLYVINPFFIYRGDNASWLRTESHLLFKTEFLLQAHAKKKLKEASAFLTEYIQLLDSSVERGKNSV